MGNSSLLCLALSLLLFNFCFAQFEQTPMRFQRQQLQQRWRTECRFERVQGLQPSRRVESEAGVSEYWDVQGDREAEDQLQCAGMAAVRHTIHRKGLLLPSFLNAPEIVYVIQGRGIHGAVIPGCPETYESGQSQQAQRSREQL